MKKKGLCLKYATVKVIRQMTVYGNWSTRNDGNPIELYESNSSQIGPQMATEMSQRTKWNSEL